MTPRAASQHGLPTQRKGDAAFDKLSAFASAWHGLPPHDRLFCRGIEPTIVCVRRLDQWWARPGDKMERIRYGTKADCVD